jgi:hypothetical protein
MGYYSPIKTEIILAYYGIDEVQNIILMKEAHSSRYGGSPL